MAMFYPGLFTMLKTCKQILTKQYEEFLLNNFSTLYQIAKKESHIPEKVFDTLGFPMDFNYIGDEVEKCWYFKRKPTTF